MDNRFFLIWLTSTLILVTAAWAAIAIGFLKCFRVEVTEEERSKNPCMTLTVIRRKPGYSYSGVPFPFSIVGVARIFSETHFLKCLERLARIAITVKGSLNWLKSMTVGATPAKQNVDRFWAGSAAAGLRASLIDLKHKAPTVLL